MLATSETIFVFIGIALPLLLLLCLGFSVLLGFWAYADAKARTDRPVVWTLIVLLVPNLLGLLIYLLVGRTKEKSGPNRFKKPLIALAASALAAVLLFVGGAVWLLTRDAAHLNSAPGVSIGVVDLAWNDQWSLSFKVSGAEFTKTVDLSEAELERFHASASCDSGKLYLRLSQREITKIFDLSGSFSETLDLSGFQPGRVELVIYNDEAKNASVRLSWRENP